MPDGRVLIDVGGNPLAATPSWARFDNLGQSCRCFGYDISTGRQTEFDITQAGEATVYFNDRNRTMDDSDLIGSPIQLQIRDPVTGLWEEQYRGVIDDTIYVPNPSAEIANVQVKCKDLFDYLSRAEMVLGLHGNPIPAHLNPDGAVFWEDGPVDTRIEDLLAVPVGAGLPEELYVVFSGNVDVGETLNDPGDSFMVALRDAVDAEFAGGIAQIYVDRFGRVNFHGRFARFDPDDVADDAGHEAWEFTRWAAATREDVITGRAAIREFDYNRPISRIRNAAIAWPREDELGKKFKEEDKAAQVRTDATSITRYGYCAMPPMGDLIIKEHKTNGNTGAEECQLFAEFWVNNYAVPRTNVQRCTFRSVRPDGVAEHKVAAETWALMTRADISDIIHLFVDEAGLVDEQFYIEGFSKAVRRLGTDDWDDVTVTPNLSPFAYYTDNVFE